VASPHVVYVTQGDSSLLLAALDTRPKGLHLKLDVRPGWLGLT
jgi:hypothetical protein